MERNFYEKPEIVLDIAVKGIVNIIKSSINNSVSDFLASSSEVYQTPDHIPTTEKVDLKIPDILNPRYSYGVEKYYELMTVNYVKNISTKVNFSSTQCIWSKYGLGARDTRFYFKNK